jgi:hypothetical protein
VIKNNTLNYNSKENNLDKEENSVKEEALIVNLLLRKERPKESKNKVYLKL